MHGGSRFWRAIERRKPLFGWPRAAPEGRILRVSRPRHNVKRSVGPVSDTALRGKHGRARTKSRCCCRKIIIPPGERALNAGAASENGGRATTRQRRGITFAGNWTAPSLTWELTTRFSFLPRGRRGAGRARVDRNSGRPRGDFGVDVRDKLIRKHHLPHEFFQRKIWRRRPAVAQSGWVTREPPPGRRDFRRSCQIVQRLTGRRRADFDDAVYVKAPRKTATGKLQVHIADVSQLRSAAAAALETREARPSARHVGVDFIFRIAPRCPNACPRRLSKRRIWLAFKPLMKTRPVDEREFVELERERGNRRNRNSRLGRANHAARRKFRDATISPVRVQLHNRAQITRGGLHEALSEQNSVSTNSSGSMAPRRFRKNKPTCRSKGAPSRPAAEPRADVVRYVPQCAPANCQFAVFEAL